MKRIESNLLCPSCNDPLRPAVLVCDGCGIRVEGPFQVNEFAALAAEDLHFLRIFVQSEGRIRDMEAALGLSYPTIRTRLTALRTKLAEASGRPPAAPLGGESASMNARPGPIAEPQSAQGTSVQEILSQLEAGALSYEEALRRIQLFNPTPQTGEHP